MIYPDGFSDPTTYEVDNEKYAKADDGKWYRLIGWVPYGAQLATQVAGAALRQRLEAMYKPPDRTYVPPDD